MTIRPTYSGVKLGSACANRFCGSLISCASSHALAVAIFTLKRGPNIDFQHTAEATRIEYALGHLAGNDLVVLVHPIRMPRKANEPPFSRREQ